MAVATVSISESNGAGGSSQGSLAILNTFF